MDSEKRKELLELYKLTSAEMLNFHESHNKRIEWFVSIIAAIGTAWIVGIVKASEWYHYIALAIGAIGIVGIAQIAQSGIEYTYRFFLQSISVRAKLEQLFGWTKPITDPLPNCGYWLNDAIIPGKYLDGRRAHSTSDLWVNERMDKNANWWPRRLFWYAGWLGWAMFAFALILTLLKHQKCI